MGEFFDGTLRGLAVAITVVALAALIGAGYQILSEQADLKRYRPPGQLIDIGGRKLHLLCAGPARGPTVVIEAGSGNDSMLWEDMVRRVSAFSHVCTYDRAGLGWSDPAPGPRSFDDRAAELNVLLGAANVPRPFVLVGHSYGGYIVRRFAAMYPADVAGMMLVDASEEEFAYAPEGLLDIEAIGRQAWRVGWLARLGLLRACVRLFPDHFDPVRGVPAEVRGLMTALYLRASRHFAIADEMAAYEKVPTAWRMAHGFGVLGTMPLAVISRGAKDPYSGVDTFPEWQDAQRRLTTLSTVSTHVIAENSGHMIQFSEPQLIAGAIRRVLSEIAKPPSQ